MVRVHTKQPVVNAKNFLVWMQEQDLVWLRAVPKIKRLATPVLSPALVQERLFAGLQMAPVAVRPASGCASFVDHEWKTGSERLTHLLGRSDARVCGPNTKRKRQ
jgi:hypothetical protein